MARKKQCRCGCGRDFQNDVSTPFRTWATSECGIRLWRSKKRREQEKTAARNKKEMAAQQRETGKAVRQLRDNDLAYQKKLTQRVVNQYIVLRDRNLPCISCETVNPNIQYAAGHFKSVGSHPELRFDPRNIHKQCNYRCNSMWSANKNGEGGTIGYIEGLKRRHGQHELDYLNGPHEATHYTCESLKVLRAAFAKKIRDMKREIGDA